MNYSEVMQIVVDAFAEANRKVIDRAKKRADESGNFIHVDGDRFGTLIGESEGNLDAYEDYCRCKSNILKGLSDLLDKELEDSLNETLHAEK